MSWRRGRTKVTTDQLQFRFFDGEAETRCPQYVIESYAPAAVHLPASSDNPIHRSSGRDLALEKHVRELLQAHGATRIAHLVRVEWNPRLRSCAGRADYRDKLISLNPELHKHPPEVHRTLRHELAHLLAQFRVGRRRIPPHGKEWRRACADLGIPDEKRCHNLPFPSIERGWRFRYECPNCHRDFPRVRKIRRAIACLACCRAHNGGEFDPRFRLKLVDRIAPARSQIMRAQRD
jgi:predicted SprT family Zn-dependent metalloprotease